MMYDIQNWYNPIIMIANVASMKTPHTDKQVIIYFN